jgi:hypothetical protein
MNKAIISYAKHLGYIAFASIVAVGSASGHTPFQFSGNDWASVLNALWIALVPVVLTWLNPNNTSYGVNASK